MLGLVRLQGRQAAAALAEQALPAASSLLDSLQQAWEGAAARQQARGKHGARRTAVPSPSATATLEAWEEEESEMRLPADLAAIGAINPRLRDVIEQHQKLQRSASAVETMLDALEAASPGAKRTRRVSKTALARLRVDQLRGLLETLGSDPRGSKDVLVGRLLDIAGSEEAAAQREQRERRAAAAGGADAAPREGVVSRRHLAAQAAVAERLAAVAARGGSYGVPEATLRESHRQMVQGSEYSHIFKPEEVAEIFAEARADDIAVIDVRGRCPFTDWMVLATARSQRLAHMLAGAVLHALKARAREVAPGVAPVVEGATEDSEWLVVDAGSVVAHIFSGAAHREEYALEELWGGPGGRHIRRVAAKQTVHTLDSLK